ncbi:sushi domain-containing protein 1 isoform 5-T5 [Odontesthes bonariensis]|uniref:sushi domain-containing protein 1 isoform X4 n=1 Tax=Odontesthes bonariensis TaxID=219752 RepID=UPI003F589832
MDVRSRTIIVFFLLFVLSGMQAEGQTALDVCATCHTNATCEDKTDGSGKVCNCKYGFVGNGRTFCQDKDECQIGAIKICGQHTMCHNTYGSYYCTCLAGYSPSNNMAVFIPNDGTHCQDIDECTIIGLCGEGGQCRNLEGSFDCSCQVGYQIHNGPEPFHPRRDSAFCKVVDCGQPVSGEDTVLQSVTGTTYRSVATFVCDEGFVWRRGDNSSVCGADGRWRGATLVCEEILCGNPPLIESTEQVWNNSTTLGSSVLYNCKEGFYNKGGHNVSICNENGEWTPPALSCQAKCGPVPFLPKSEVVWHNRSVVVHRCMAGYHSWRGSNVSVCGSSGEWQRASLRCVEIKPPINHLFIYNGNCLRWKAEKYDEDVEVYKVTYTGSRDYQRSFNDRGRHFLSSKVDQLELCLNLLPLTNYSVSITAESVRFTATITTNTTLTVPLAPVVYYKEFETPVPTLRLHRLPNTLDPLSLYQVFVLPVEGIMMFDCSSPASLDSSSKIKSPAEYITAQLNVRNLGTEVNFTVGDGLFYGSFYNLPLESGKNYYIILRAVNQWKMASKSCCVLWAKVTGTSYVLRVSSLSAAVIVGVAALVLLCGYSFTWYGNHFFNVKNLSVDVDSQSFGSW